MLDLNNPDASKVILSDIQEKIFGIEKAMSTFLSWLDNLCLIHVSLIPVLGVVGEQVLLNYLCITVVDLV
ncbi:hypothetical protein Fmac_025453 [Flemingia macrophylla]|uniref:Uncharacterized protein n=1 Tax=Flemingia macrophylla TaxID=520843 RepID=A0ABD1LSB9_9FABA